MAKDPAMLWYWGDWFSGTSLMSRFIKGCYMDILHAQFNHGRLSLEEIKVCLGSDFGSSWPTLQKKFKQDNNGLFFNERLEYEKERRQKFVNSRSNNKSGKKKSYDKPYDKHMKHHMENENENIGSKDTKKEIPEIKNPPPEPVGSAAVQVAANEAWKDQFWKESICMANSISIDDLKNWMAMYNASIINDTIHGFNSATYRKMFGGWLQKQKAKGYTVSQPKKEIERAWK